MKEGEYLRICKNISGFCPTLKKENSIELVYEVVEKAGKVSKYVQIGADCEYASYGNCPIMLDCPIRAKAPEVINND